MSAFCLVAGFGGYTVVSTAGSAGAPGGRRPSPPAPAAGPAGPQAHRPGPPPGPSAGPCAAGPSRWAAPADPQDERRRPPAAPPAVGRGRGPVLEVRRRPAPEVVEKPRFRDRLGKARSLLASQLAGMRGRTKLDQEAWDELEEALVLADVGILTTEALLQDLKQTGASGAA